MVEIFYTEMMKLYKSKILWLVPIAALLPVFLVYIQFGRLDWGTSLNIANIYLNGLGMPMFILLAGYIFVREYSENTMNQLFIYPQPRIRIFIAKLFLLLPVIIVTYLLSVLILLVAGTFLNKGELTASLMASTIMVYMRMALIQFLLVPLATAAAIAGRNFITVTLTGISAFLLTFATVFNMKKIIIPWAVPYVIAIQHGVIENKVFPDLQWDMGFALLILGMSSILCLTFSAAHYLKSEIR